MATESAFLKSQVLTMNCGRIEVFRLLGISLDIESFSLALLLCLISLFTSAIGLATRLSMVTASLCFFLVIGTSIGCTTGGNPEAYTPWNHSIIFLNLLILCFSPGISAYSLDHLLLKRFNKNIFTPTMPNWPIWLIKFNLVHSYFSGGIVKLRYGLDWMNGYTAQWYLLHRHLNIDIPLGFELAQQFYLLVFISVGLMVTEILIPVALFHRKSAIIFIGITLLAQLGTWYIVDLKWMHYFGFAYLIYFVEIIAYSQNKYTKWHTLHKFKEA